MEKMSKIWKNFVVPFRLINYLPTLSQAEIKLLLALYYLGGSSRKPSFTIGVSIILLEIRTGLPNEQIIHALKSLETKEFISDLEIIPSGKSKNIFCTLRTIPKRQKKPITATATQRSKVM